MAANYHLVAFIAETSPVTPIFFFIKCLVLMLIMYGATLKNSIKSSMKTFNEKNCHRAVVAILNRHCSHSNNSCSSQLVI